MKSVPRGGKEKAEVGEDNKYGDDENVGRGDEDNAKKSTDAPQFAGRSRESGSSKE
jgi:hypothetical protein